MELEEDLQQIAEANDFSGVLLVSRDGRPAVEIVRGLANRAERIPTGGGTRFATASATKGFTALTIASLIEEGQLSLGTTLRSLVGNDLPSVDPAVSIEDLLGHTSGVGDYLDEETLGDIDDYVLDVSAHTLQGPEDYLAILNRFDQVEPPGTRFTYNNSGYVMLALVADRLSGQTYHQLVQDRVFGPAAMTESGFFRSDHPPSDTATGYLKDGRSNVFHLPVIGTGDGGAYTTAADMISFWTALFEGRIVSLETVETMTALRSVTNVEVNAGYGLGFWLRNGGETVMLEGMDAGVSFRSAYHRPSRWCYAVLCNDSSGVWPLSAHVNEVLDQLDR